MARRKSLEERIAERQARRPPLEEGKTFEHGPAKYLFIVLISIIVLGHFIGLFVLMGLGIH
ncbi:hypothetical protein [Planotetraspora sp. GP83]|uniref:hypothetical protein n=1 Tax=Planotetraspora sp. GP83 TaxID=3156264 RepID=UPI003518A038